MRLTRLEMKGFKSFKDKTVLDFPDDFMGVVGPNGSGKSNITEAVCFVLGKSRGLRAANLTELIFNGGVEGEPASKAVVSLTLSDKKKLTHKITRIIERDGTSIYKINDKRSTRQKILEIVGDSEYNIVLQDDIYKVVDMKPKDRRKIIDDLCGIGQYDEKRDKAIRELQKVESKIEHTIVILGQKAGYLTTLKKERDEAVRYTNVRDEIRSAKATRLSKEISSLEKRDEKIMETTQKLHDEKVHAQQKIAECERIVAESRIRMRQISQQIIDLEEKRRGTSIAETRGEVLRIEDRMNMQNERLQKITQELTSRKKQIHDFGIHRENAEKHLEKVEEESIRLMQQIDALAKLAVDEGVQTAQDELKAKVYGAKSKIQAIIQIQQSRQSEIENLTTERKRIEAKIKTGMSSEQTSHKSIEKSAQAYEAANADLKKYKKTLEELNQDYETLQQELRNIELSLGRKQAELEAIVRSSGGLQKAVKAVMQLKKVIPGIHGPVFQLGEVTDEKYKLAMQIAAGGRMQYVVVSKVEDASKCIDYLRKKQIGRCTFLPVDKINTRVHTDLPRGALGFARDFIKGSKSHSPVFDYVFGNTIIVADINAAKAIGVGSHRMVTLEGDLLETTGAMTGGFNQRNVEISFSNIDDLESEIAKLTKEKDHLGGVVIKRKDERDKIRSTVDILVERVAQHKHELDEEAMEKNIVSEVRSNLRETLERTVENIAKNERILKETAVELKNLEKIASSDEKELKKMLSTESGPEKSKLEKLKDSLHNEQLVREKLMQQVEHITGQQKEYTKLNEGLQREDVQIRDLIAGLKDQVAKLKQGLIDLENAQRTVDGSLKELIRERSELEERITESSSEKGALEARIASEADKLSEYMIEKAKITTRLEDLKKEFTRYEGVELMASSAKDLDELIEKLEQMLLDYGSVNLKAVQTYDTVQLEYDEMAEKLNTLKQEKQSIFDFMDKIEDRKKKTFMEAFEKVKVNFEAIFATLSEGKGTLIIDNPMNISEAGLFIKASPKGKKLMSLEAMSGGEKTLTSATFMLAIQQYKPSFFYIVDELDAPLDYSNSIRLARMLAESKSQFMMVTHNNNMLKYMDSAIGVSMVKGISHIVGVRFTEDSKEKPDSFPGDSKGESTSLPEDSKDDSDSFPGDSKGESTSLPDDLKEEPDSFTEGSKDDSS